MAAPSQCRHCRRRVQTHGRGLCWACRMDRTIRDQYPTCPKHGRRGVGLGHRCHAPLPTPTSAPPGTEAKLTELELRAAAGLSLFHPHDATHGGLA